jgi:hypothetical protein
MMIFPGPMYLYSANTPGVSISKFSHLNFKNIISFNNLFSLQAIKVHESQEVYIPKNIYDDIVKESRSLPLLVKHLVKNVFTREALQGSTAQGYPNRVRGSNRLRQEDVLPRLDPAGRDAILSKLFSSSH